MGCRGTSRRRPATQRAHRGRRPHHVRAPLQDGPGGPITSGGANQGERSQQLQRGQRPLQGINSGHQTSPTTKPATTNATRKTSVSMIRLCRPGAGSGSVASAQCHLIPGHEPGRRCCRAADSGCDRSSARRRRRSARSSLGTLIAAKVDRRSYCTKGHYHVGDRGATIRLPTDCRYCWRQAREDIVFTERWRSH